jgi:Saxitoxin biosynthesis operon protein SxtJ
MRYRRNLRAPGSSMSTHEFATAHRKWTGSSDRSFGIVVAIVFATIGLWPLSAGQPPRMWSLALATGFLALAALAPVLLAPLNRSWFRLGKVLYRITNPIVMGIMFFGVIMPMGFVLRMLGHDLLRLRKDSAATTYWVVREPPGPKLGSMSKQF